MNDSNQISDNNLENQLIKKGMEALPGLINRVFGPALDEFGLYMKDRVSWWRTKQLLKVLTMTEEYQQKLNLPKQEIPLKLSATMIEGCSWEDDEYMQEKWAALLVNATTEGEDITNYIGYTDILGKLSPLQAQCLDLMYNEKKAPLKRLYRKVPSYCWCSWLSETMKIPLNEFKITLDALKRFNLIHVKTSIRANIDTVELSKEIARKSQYRITKPIEYSYDEVSLSYLGQALVRKCRIQFREKHAEQLIIILNKHIEDIARNPKEYYLHKLSDEIKAVYKYSDYDDVRNSVYKALNRYSPGSQITPFTEPVMPEELKEKIINQIILYFDFVHGDYKKYENKFLAY